MELPEYLDESFDPNTQTIPQLMQILTKCNVEFPMIKHRKEYYISLFQEQVVPKRVKLIKELQKPLKKTGIIQEDKPASSPRAKRKSTRSMVSDALNLKNSNSAPQSTKSSKKEPLVIDLSTPKTPAKKNDELKNVQTPSRFINLDALNLEYNDTPSKTVTPGVIESITAKKDDKCNELIKESKPNALFKVFLFLPVALVLGIFGHWYIQVNEKFGYCPANYPVDSILSHLLPKCIDCPPNAECFGRAIKCDPDFVLSSVSLIDPVISMLLLPPKCVPDQKKKLRQVKQSKRVQNLETVINEQVREWTGRALCGTLQPDDQNEYSFAFGSHKTVLGMPMSLVKQNLWQKLSQKWQKEEFQEYWDLVLQHILSTDSKLSLIMDDSGQHRLFTSSDAPILSVVCSARMALWSSAKRYSLEFSAGGVLLLTILCLYYSRIQNQLEKKKLSILVHDVLGMIHEEADNYARDPVRHPIPGLASNHLRDYLLLQVLPDDIQRIENGDAVLDQMHRTRWLVTDKGSRDRLWKHVREIILKNSSIRETIMDLKGDTYSVWQWVASSALSPLKNRK